MVFKAFAGRDKDWWDIDGVLARQAGRFDVKLVWRELRPLLDLKPSPKTEARLRALIERSSAEVALDRSARGLSEVFAHPRGQAPLSQLSGGQGEHDGDDLRLWRLQLASR